MLKVLLKKYNGGTEIWFKIISLEIINFNIWIWIM